jgi:hypothetical protein
MRVAEISAVPEVEAPGEWFDGTQEWAGPADEVALEALSAADSLISRTLSQTTAHHARRFKEAMSATLGGPLGSVVITYPSEVPPARALSTFAAWLGVVPDQISRAIGGHINIVRSGVGHRHDQAWHTDSTPWIVPNRWTLLSRLRIVEPATAPATGILPISTLATLLSENPRALILLRRQPIEWRANFPNLPQLMAPILDASYPRWVQPVVAAHLDSVDQEFVHAVRAMECAISKAPYAEATVTSGRMLAFDNYRVMHRGPRIEETVGRHLLRIKVGGRPA